MASISEALLPGEAPLLFTALFHDMNRVLLIAIAFYCGVCMRVVADTSAQMGTWR